MAQNRGKQFEDVIKNALEAVPRVSVDRFHDQMNGYLGSTNICDFVAYRKPYEFYFECKSIHGNTLSISSIPKPDKKGALHGYHGNITDTQWTGLLDKSKIPGVFAGVICWWVDKDTTRFIPIQVLEELYHQGHKSIRYNVPFRDVPAIAGKKKRVFFEYDMERLLDELTTQEG